MNYSIQVKALSKTFISNNKKKVHALDNINISIKHGEFICLLGPSGSGKSTFLRLIAGLEKPCSGRIKVLSKNINKPIKEAAMVFQEYSLMPWRNIIDNVSFGLELQNISREIRYKKANEILNQFGLGEFTTQFPYELSGGMRQRAAIARALAIEPSILYMDEPFGALDAYTRYGMQKDLIEYWVDDKRTIVFVTHSVEEALFLGTRIIVMSPRPGKIVEDIPINLEYPRNRFDKKFKEHFEFLMKTMNDLSKNEI